jgi:osmotically-inducible protein OsmY
LGSSRRGKFQREDAEETAMSYRYGKRGFRMLGAAIAASWCLVIAGCGKTPAPAEPVKSAAPPAPIAESANQSQKPAPQRIDPAAARDTALAAAVTAALAADSRLRSFGIDTRAANGAVELFGTVDSESSREKAGKIAAAVAGVKSVKNHLVLVSGS